MNLLFSFSVIMNYKRKSNIRKNYIMRTNLLHFFQCQASGLIIDPIKDPI